jgi:enterochelin esterase family protein
MTRPLAAVAAVLLVAPLVSAQDMPLSQILIAGEGWREANGPFNHISASPPATRSPDGGTEFSWKPGETFLHARQLPDGVRAPYAPLRIPPKGPAHVGELATDRDGRVYAATPVGVQVFDPTGRLCGVVASPALGAAVELLWFDGDTLVAVANGTRYTRKLRTRGAQ